MLAYPTIQNIDSNEITNLNPIISEETIKKNSQVRLMSKKYEQSRKFTKSKNVRMSVLYFLNLENS